MVAYQLLIRTIHAANDARENGFENTAEAFDKIIESLLELQEPEFQLKGEALSRHLSERPPQRLSTRFG